MVQVKICGLMRNEDALAVNQAGADFAGFVFAPSRHQINIEQALKLRRIINPSIPTVGVFVNETVDQILKVYHSGAIKIAQLHGKSNPAMIGLLQVAGLKVIQVFERKNIDLTSRADYLMTDSGKGSGQTLTWREFPSSRTPLILAGGLNPSNVEEAIRIVKPDIVDVSSGVETDGKKDEHKIISFVDTVKKGVKL